MAARKRPGACVRGIERSSHSPCQSTSYPRAANELPTGGWLAWAGSHGSDSATYGSSADVSILLSLAASTGGRLGSRPSS